MGVIQQAGQALALLEEPSGQHKPMSMRFEQLFSMGTPGPPPNG